MLPLIPDKHDEPIFVDLVARLLHAWVAELTPENVYVVHINNWFDHKWKAFSTVPWNWAGAIRRVPPFHPNRVVSQMCFRRSDGAPDSYVPVKAEPLHVTARDPKREQRLSAIGESCLFLWYSGNTQRNDRGSVMVYHVDGEHQPNWYVSFLKRVDWRLGLVKGDISNAEVSRCLACQVSGSR